MSLGESDAKFPGQTGTGLPPSPTPENPGQVYPKSDPSPGPRPPSNQPHTAQQHVGNPFLITEALSKLDHALNEVIDVLDKEKGAYQPTSSAAEDPLLSKFKSWRDDLVKVQLATRTSDGGAENRLPPSAEKQQEGGLFTD